MKTRQGVQIWQLKDQAKLMSEQITELKARVTVLEAATGNTKGAAKFVPPTVEEVQKYTPEVDAHKFVNFYESKGWMVGKNKMKSWKAAVRNWCLDGERSGGPSTNRASTADKEKNAAEFRRTHIIKEGRSLGLTDESLDKILLESGLDVT